MRLKLLVLVAGLAAACGSPMKPPVTGVLALSSISPSTLSTTGGATVTITGTGFGTDAAVKVDGVTVTGAAITATSITFTAPAHAAGTGSITVATGGKTGSLNATFVAPSGINAPPVITNLRVSGPGNKPPSPFVDLSSNVALSATVTDVETSPAALTYTWTVAAGTIIGTGASVTWNLPASLAVTPSAVTATLTVAETFTENGVQHRNLVTASFLADAHDSQTEILNKGFRFLDLFSQSQYTPAEVLADFDQATGGYDGELRDVVNNRNTYVQLPGYSIQRLPPVTFNFGGICPNQAFGDNRREHGDACSSFDVHWFARYKVDIFQDGQLIIPAGTLEDSLGRDFVTASLRDGQWKLVGSGYLPSRPPIRTLPNGTQVMTAFPAMAGFGGLKKRRQ